MARGKIQGATKKRWSITKRIRKFGFRKRLQSVGGKRVLKNRRNKGRSALSVSNEMGTNKAAKDKRFRRRR